MIFQFTHQFRVERSVALELQIMEIFTPLILKQQVLELTLFRIHTQITLIA